MALLAFRPRSFLRAFFAFLLVWPLLVQPVMAQSILRDAETEALFHDISLPLIKAAGLDPRNVRIVLIGDKSINAFTAGGQDVFINSGLLAAADNANEVQGVIAHELGHVAGGHVLRSQEGIKQATGIMLLSLLLGAAAIAAGAGDAGVGILGAGQELAITVSMGWCPHPLWPSLPTDWHLSLRIADDALYQAKSGGRNRWVGYVPGEAPNEPPSLENGTAELELSGQLLRRAQPEPSER